MIEKILKILEASLIKNGDKPLTISHFINIIKMAKRQSEQEEQFIDELELQGEYDAECYGDRS